MHDAAQVQSQMMQNRLYQQEFVAKQAMGGIIQQSIDPETGIPDWNKAGILMSMDPRTSFKAPEFLTQLATQRKLNLETFGVKLKNAQTQTELIGNMAAPVLKDWMDNPSKNADMKPLINQAGLLVGQDAELGDKVWDQIITLKTMSPQERTEALANIVKQSQIASKGFDSVYKALDFERVDPLTDKKFKTMGQVDIVSGQFNPYNLTGATQVQGKPSSIIDAPTEQTESGTMKAPVQNPPLPSGTVQTGIGTVQEEGLKKVATEYIPELGSRVATANQLLLTMQQAEDSLRDFKPGGGQSFLTELSSLAQAAGMPQEFVDSISGGREGGLGSVQEARKILFGVGSQIAAALIRAGGGRMTQTEWAKTLSEGAPSVDLDERAVKGIIKAMKEVVAYTKAEGQAFSDYRDANGDLTKWQTDVWPQVFGKLLARREGGRHAR